MQYLKYSTISAFEEMTNYGTSTCRQKHVIIHTRLANTTVRFSLHPTRALSYTAVIGKTKELSIRTVNYKIMFVTEINFGGDFYYFIALI